jgi:phosphotransferase system HPr-like phosphotransfer protein
MWRFAVEPKSLVQFISEEEFLELVKEPSTFFFKFYNSFATRMESGKGISRKFYSNLIQEAEFLESFLDEFGARENKKWSFFTEYVACIRNLGITAFFIKHLLDRYPFYNLQKNKENHDQFQAHAQNSLEFLNLSILNIYKEVTQAANINGLTFPTESVSPNEISDIESNKRLPRSIAEDEVKDEEEQIIELCDKIQEVAQKMQKIKISFSDDLETLKKMIPYKINERKARALKEDVHSLQSDYDTYIKNTKLEYGHPMIKNLRGHISMTLHLLEVVLWLCHFYERHEDEIRPGECKSKITEMVSKTELLSQIINFGFYYSKLFMTNGSELAEEIIKNFIKTGTIEVPIPKPLGFHARPSTYVSLIARQYDEDLFLIVDGEKYSSKSVMSMLQAGGAIADKGYQTVIFEGSSRVLEDIKILSDHNYCEEEDIPKQLSYLRELKNSA